MLSALFAYYICGFVGHLYPLALHIMLGFFEGSGKISVEVFQDIVPFFLALFDLIEAALHLGGELCIYDVFKVVFEHFRDDIAEGRGLELFLLALDIMAVKNGGDGRRVGRGAADAVFLQCLYETCFGKARGRLGEMLVAEERIHTQLLVFRELRNSAALLVCIIRAFFVKAGETVELYGKACGLEKAVSRRYIYRSRVKQCILHLARHKALPDQLVELELVIGETAFYLFGSDIYS